MPEDTTLYDALKRKVDEISTSVEDLFFTLYKKTGADSGSIQGTKMQSVNFKTGVSGWELTPDGNLEANTGTFRGALAANSLDIPDTTTANSFHVNPAGDTWWGATTFGAAVASISKAGAAIFSNVTIAGYSLATSGTFGGDGRDGALTLTSGTTTLSFASVSFLLKNYTSISITSTGKLATSTPNTSGSALILKSQGAVTITSGATCIDVSAMGGAGGAAVSQSAIADYPGTTGTAGAVVVFKSNPGAGPVSSSVGGVGGSATINSVLYPSTFVQALNRYPLALVGSGGASGSVNVANTASTTTSGAGGRGGGCLIIECAGAFNYTTASGLSAAGSAGSAATATPAGNAAGGGGGGSGGFILVLYNSLTATTSAVVTGGAGGIGHDDASHVVYAGGGGGGLLSAGSSGTTDTNDGTVVGGAGAAGIATIDKNEIFA